MIISTIIAVYFIMVSLILTYELFKARQELKVEKSVSDMYHNSAEEYWGYYMNEQRKNRSKALLIKELQEENAELEELFAHTDSLLDDANEWADGWEEAYKRVLEEWKVALKEKEELEAKNQHLKLELEYYRQKYEGDYDPIE